MTKPAAVKSPMVLAWLRVGVGLSILFLLLTQFRSCQISPGFGPVTDQHFRRDGHREPQLVELGRALFFEQELSGNRNISCGTCHNPQFATTDALSLPVGEGGQGVGVQRHAGRTAARARQRVSRNAPALFNLGAREFRQLFHDGRVAVDERTSSGFGTPAGEDLPHGLDSVLAAQALFPLTMATEMAGQPGENEVADAVGRAELAGEGGAWELLVERLRAIPTYVEQFTRVFDDIISPDDMRIVHVVNAIAAFEESAFRSDQSPFDRYLRGERHALTPAQIRGMHLFYGGGERCSRCHAGPFQTDHQFHSIGMPQLGPGAGDGVDGCDDFGRENVTGDAQDRYRFRTPSLRNVELTGPWGHAGGYATLEAMLEHYRQEDHGLTHYDPKQAVLPMLLEVDESDFVVMQDPKRAAAIVTSSEARSLQLTQLSRNEVSDLIAFLRALTDPRARDLHLTPGAYSNHGSE